MARGVPHHTRMRLIPPTRRSGFTMIEMIIVFVVFGAVAMISIRSVGETLRRDRVAKATAILGADIEQAFAIAARQRTPVMMVLDRANKTFSIIDRNSSTNIYRRRKFDKTADYGVDTLYANKDTIYIMPNGLATDTLNLTLRIVSRGGALYTKSVRSSLGGMVRVDNR
jgi:prepilin-type N-terminal cleavage/methylation domain-containing protein